MPKADDKPQARLYIQQDGLHTFTLHAEFSIFSGDPDRVLVEFWKDWKSAHAIPDRIHPLLSGGSWTVTYAQQGIYRPAVRITDAQGRSSFVQSVVFAGATDVEKPLFTTGEGPSNPWNGLGTPTQNIGSEIVSLLSAAAAHLHPPEAFHCRSAIRPLKLDSALERSLAKARDAFQASVELWTPEGRRRAEWRRRITSRRTWN